MRNNIYFAFFSAITLANRFNQHLIDSLEVLQFCLCLKILLCTMTTTWIKGYCREEKHV